MVPSERLELSLCNVRSVADYPIADEGDKLKLRNKKPLTLFVRGSVRLGSTSRYTETPLVGLPCCSILSRSDHPLFVARNIASRVVG